MAKKLWTKRYPVDIIEAVEKVKKKTGKTHTDFIMEAIDEKLVRDGHEEESLLGDKINKA